MVGVAAGTCAGFLSGFLSTKGLKMSRNTGLLSGLLSGVVVGSVSPFSFSRLNGMGLMKNEIRYIFTQESLKIQLKKAQDSNEALKKHLEQDDKRGGFVPDERGMEGMSLRERREVWDMTRGERGSGGMEGFEDKYQSTRGDH